MENALETITALLTKWGLSILGAIAILIIGRIVAGIVRSMLRKLMKKTDSDPSLIGFVSGIVYYAVIIFAVVAALAKFGIQTASFVAVLGAAGFAVGFALQGSLGNFASGVMLLVFRPFTVGDFVNISGVAGSVKEIGIFTTVLATPDNVKIMVPNGKIYGDTITNYTAFDTRRVDWAIGIGYESPMGKAKEIMERILNEDSRVLDDPASQIAVSELADSSVNFVMRGWVKKEDYWAVKFDLTRKVKEEFDKNDIEIPFPQRVVHHVNPPAA